MITACRWNVTLSEVNSVVLHPYIESEQNETFLSLIITDGILRACFIRV